VARARGRARRRRARAGRRALRLRDALLVPRRRRTRSDASRESAALARASRDPLALGNALTFLSQVQIGLGEPAAEGVAREALACFREAGQPWERGIGAVNLGNVLRALDRPDEAGGLYRESAPCFEATDDGWGVAMSLRNLGTIALRRGDHAEALALNRRALELLLPLDEKWFVSRGLEDMAGSLCALGDLEAEAQLLGAGEALRESVGADVVPFYRPDYDRAVARVRSALDPATLDAAWARGRAATRADAIAFALARPQR
jgi:tetratricopeptide (TPR) repeat protein